MRSRPSIRTRTGWVSAFICWGDGVIEVRSTRSPYNCKEFICKQFFAIVTASGPRRADGTVPVVFFPSVALAAALLAGAAVAPHPAARPEAGARPR